LFDVKNQTGIVCFEAGCTSAIIITFRVMNRRGDTYIGYGHLCVCLSVPHRIPTLLHGPGCNLGEG